MQFAVADPPLQVGAVKILIHKPRIIERRAVTSGDGELVEMSVSGVDAVCIFERWADRALTATRCEDRGDFASVIRR
jgi:hypothetical protein